MKTHPCNRKFKKNTAHLLLSLAASLALLALIMLATACTVSVSPDGTKSATVDAPTAIRVLEIIATK
jgi:hypothetical protein